MGIGPQMLSKRRDDVSEYSQSQHDQRELMTSQIDRHISSVYLVPRRSQSPDLGPATLDSVLEPGSKMSDGEPGSTSQCTAREGLHCSKESTCCEGSRQVGWKPCEPECGSC